MATLLLTQTPPLQGGQHLVGAMHKPFSRACENNKGPILDILRQTLVGSQRVLEIGSGTGQHAVHFAAALPGLAWQCSDQGVNLPGIRAWLEEARLSNLAAPISLDVTGDWPGQTFDAIYTANTCHIMSWAMVEAMFAGIGRCLQRPGTLLIYGPFNYGGQFTSPSNARFDQHLREMHPQQGIRDIEAVAALARQIGLTLHDDIAMPANNRLLVWRR